MTAGPYEVAARTRKAAALAGALDAILSERDDPGALLDGTAEMELVWAAVATVTGTRPAGPATRTEVVRLLRCHARPPADPFRNLTEKEST